MVMKNVALNFTSTEFTVEESWIGAQHQYSSDTEMSYNRSLMEIVEIYI